VRAIRLIGCIQWCGISKKLENRYGFAPELPQVAEGWTLSLTNPRELGNLLIHMRILPT
jgi:hypothetical protein